MNNNLIKIAGWKQHFAGALVLSLPLLSLITTWGVGLASFVFLVAALCMPRRCGQLLARHWTALRWVLLAFLFNFLYTVVCQVRPEAHLGALEEPARMLFAASALILVVLYKPDRFWLWRGVTAGAVAGALLVAYQRLVLDVDRPGGLINPITFGDMSLCLGLVALAAAIDYRGRRQALWPALGALAGLTGSILTGTRGGWVALVMAAVVFLCYSHVLSSKRVRLLVVLSFALVAGTFFVPDTGVRERVEQGMYDVTTYFDGGSAFSNVGIRLELWKGAAQLIGEHPLVGMGELSPRAMLEQRVKQGQLDPVVLIMPHFHNDALQALVTGGIVGLLAWISTLVAPAMFFARALRRRAQASKEQFAVALAGLLVVVSYFSFGLTEVIFWSVRASMFYALMVFILMGFCLNAQAVSARFDGKDDNAS